MKIRLLALLLALLAVPLLTVACKDDDEGQESSGEQPQQEENGEQTPEYYDAGTVEGAITWEFYADGTLYVKGSGEMSDFITGAEEGNNQQPWGSYASAIKKVVVEDGVTRLSQLSFKHCINLTEAVLGRGITTLPSECFANCYALKKVEAKSVTVLEECALENCLQLETLTLSTSLSKVEQGALGSACTESTGLTLKLAGTEAEWNTAKATLEISDPDHSEKIFVDAMKNVSFVAK